MEDLVGVGVADAAEDARVGEGALEGAVFGGERGAKGFEVASEKTSMPPGSMARMARFAGEEMQGCAALGAGFGEDERAGGKVEGGEVVSSAELCAPRGRQ